MPVPAYGAAYLRLEGIANPALEVVIVISLAFTSGAMALWKLANELFDRLSRKVPASLSLPKDDTSMAD